MEKCKFEIYDIMACNVYRDFGKPVMEKEQHKFLISFLATEGEFTPELIENITAYGPDDYRVEFNNQIFTPENRNGHIYDKTMNSYWYMVNLDSGFMKEGEYTIEVKCKNGDVKTKSRFQKNAPSEAIVSGYLENREKLYNSFSPSKKVSIHTPLKNVKVKWSTLKELSNLDTFSIFRVSEGGSGMEFDVQKLIAWDNIFVERYENENAGLNRGEVVIREELKSNTSYVYFTEITDSNIMGETNICIFQPYQVFSTP